MSHEAERAETNVPTSAGASPAPSSGMSMRGAVRGVDGYTAQAERLAPVQMRRAVQRDVGVPEVTGDARASVDPTQASVDLRHRLVTRQREVDAQIAAVPRTPGDRREFRERTAAMRRERDALDVDLRILQQGTANRETIERIARRHTIPAEELGRSVRVLGNSQTTATSTSATGIGITHSETAESASAAPGGVDTVTATRATTTNIDASGLNRSTSSTLSANGADGSVASRGQSSSRTIGSNAGGVGMSSTESVTGTTREAGTGGAAGAGSSESRSTSSYGGVSVSDDSVSAGAGRSRTQSETTYTGSGASSTSTSQSGSSGAATMDDSGNLTAASMTSNQSQTSSERDASGTETARSSTSSSVTAGYVNGDEGEGYTLGGTVREDNRTQESASSASATGSATFTDQQVGATGSGNVSMGEGPVAVNGSLGGGMTFRIDVREVPDTRPKQYNLVTIFRYEISVGVGAGTNDNRLGASSTNSARVGVSARAVRTSSFSNRMTQAEVAAYQAELQRIERAPAGRPGPSDKPALRFAARLRAFGAAGNFPTEADLLGDGREMEMNASVSIGGSDTETATASGQVGGGGVSVGAGGSLGHGSEVERTRARLMVDGRDTVRFTLVFAETDSTSVSGNASFEGIGGRAQHDTATRRGNRVVIDLDPTAPDYAERERAVLAVADRHAADQLARECGAEITRETRDSTTDSAGVGVMDGGNVSTGLSTTSTRSTGSSVTMGRRGPNGRRTLRGGTSGASSDSGSVSVLGHAVANASSTTTAEATVDAEGQQRIAVSNTESEGVPLPGMLQQLWRTTEQEINSIDISESDMTVLVSRARDNHRWTNCLAGAELLHIQADWRRLQGRLLRPSPERDWVRIDATIANKIARGQAITQFIGTVGAAHGRNAIHAVMRNYDRTEALGTQWEWPDALREHERTYAGLRTSLRGARERFAGITGEAREALIQEEVTRIARGLERIKQAVASCGSFRQESVKVEMLDALDREVREIHRIGNQATAPAGATTAAAETNAGGEAQTRKQEELATAKTSAFRFKRSERSHMERSRQHMREARERVFTNCHDDVREAMEQLLAIERDWQGLWGTAWRSYVALSNELHLNSAIDYDLRTNVSYRIQLMNQAVALDGNLAGFWEAGAIATRWRSQGGF